MKEEEPRSSRANLCQMKEDKPRSSRGSLFPFPTFPLTLDPLLPSMKKFPIMIWFWELTSWIKLWPYLCRWNRQRSWDSTGFLKCLSFYLRIDILATVPLCVNKPQWGSLWSKHSQLPICLAIQEFPAQFLVLLEFCGSDRAVGILVLNKPHLQQFVTDMLASCSVTLWTCEVQGCMKLESNGESMAELFSRPCKDKAETRHYATSKVKAFTTNLYRKFLTCVPMSKF